jgi:osmotically-inducible protein OsmY
MIASLQACSFGVGTRVGANSAELYSEGAQLDDGIIEKKTMARIKDNYGETAQVTVTSHNRAVLLTGEALSADIQNKIERIIYSVPNVKKITNKLTIGPLASAVSRRNDARITASIKSTVNSNKIIKVGVIRVVSDKGVVYLLGLVPRAEAAAAAEIASKTEGVVRVIRAFDYID